MASPLPHNSQLRQEATLFLTDAADLVSKNCEDLNDSGDWRAIYKATLATDAVLAGLKTRRARPRLGVIRSCSQRVPFLIACGQLAGAQIELRRLIEHLFRCVYFTEHPIEWAELLETPSMGLGRESSLPIQHAAHREPSFYRNYAKERMQREPSGFATKAVITLSTEYQTLSHVVHGRHNPLKNTLTPPLEPLSPAKLSAFSKTDKRIRSSATLVTAALFRKNFDSLEPMPRAWFDWLQGKTNAQKIRSSPFGL